MLFRSRVAGVPASRVTIFPVAVPDLNCNLALGISPPDLRPHQYADILFQQLKRRLHTAESNEPSLRAVMPAVLKELLRQFNRAVPYVFT